MLKIVKNGTNIDLVLDAPLQLRLDKSLVADVARGVQWYKSNAIGEDEELGGFFSSLTSVVNKVQSIASNPLVRAAVSVVPFGGTALTAIDAAGAAVQLGNKALAKLPSKPRKLARLAARGNKKALAELNKLKKANSPQLVQVKKALKIMRDAADARKFLETSTGIPEHSSDEIIDTTFDLLDARNENSSMTESESEE